MPAAIDPATASPAFVVGITGHMDIPTGDEARIKDRLTQVFQWLRDPPEVIDASDAEVPAWWPLIERRRFTPDGRTDERSERRLRPLPGLGLGNRPVLLLTSLAPGVDTLAAEVVAECAAFEIRAALPFPAELYTSSTSFSENADPEKARKKFEDCLASLDHPRDQFPVLLQSDLELDPEERARTFRSDLKIPERRHLRYRAAGEYVAAYSHLLIALYTPMNEEEPGAAGTEAIVAVRRHGPTSGILPAANHFPWIDSGPVLHLPTRSLKRMESTDSAALADGSWQSIAARFLPPAPPEKEEQEAPSEITPEAIREGYGSLRESARLTDRYREAAEATESQPPEDSLEKLIGLADLTEAGLSSVGRNFLKGLLPLTAARAAAAGVADVSDRSRQWMMKIMAACAILAALAFHGFSHWHFAHPRGEPGHAGGAQHLSEQKWASFSFLLITIGIVIFAALRYRSYRKSNGEWLRFDARALAEGLRIQFYWAAAGTSASVASLYMHRQKGQLDWIRDAISALSFPYQHWKESFEALPIKDRQQILGEVILAWLGGQRTFFSRTVKKCRHLLHRFHTLGWGLTWTGLFQSILLLFCVFIHPPGKTDSPDAAFPGITGFFALIAGMGIFGFLLSKRASAKEGPSSSDEKEDRRSVFLETTLDHFLSGGIWPVAFFGSALIGLAAFLLPLLPHHFGDHFWWITGPLDLWIILTGAALVGGAILIAWAEKLTLAEHTRQYEAMDQLFTNAEAHARRLLADWKRDPSSPESLRELHLLLTDLGKEALDENAEWLLLHRSRPFEPFLAG